MDELIINLIIEQIQEAEELGEKGVHVEFYQTLLNYHVTCLEILYDDIFHANQQLRDFT